MRTSRSRRIAARTLAAVVGLAVVAACGGSSDDSTPSRTSAAAQSDPGPGGLPADVLDLSSWKLTLPVGSDEDEDEAEEIKQPDLATFSDDRFFTTTRDGSGVVFRAPAGGATTSGSGYPAPSCARWSPAASPRRAGRTRPGPM